MSNMGHNETAVRLAGLVGDAQVALDKIGRGEADATEGWMAYGAALNEGRALFAEDKAFGRWIAENLSSNLEIHPAEQSAAMWAAANADQLSEAKAASKARTLRGWHDQWKKIQSDREAESRKAQEKADREAAKAKADTDRKEADERAAAEAKAVAEAKAATNEADRKAAEDRAEQERVAKEAAQAAAVAAEQAANEPEPEPEEIPADVAAVMRKHSALTREALLRDYAELVVQAKAERAKAKDEIADLKAKLAELSDDDKDGVIRSLQAKVKNADSAKWRATEEQRVAMKQVYALKKRVAELEGMEVGL